MLLSKILLLKNSIDIISRRVVLAGCCFIFLQMSSCRTSRSNSIVKETVMENIYKEIRTPYKYGIVFRHPDSTKLMDSPSIFRWNDSWFMTYIIFDGKGYETWLAESNDLL